jgi:hypothetical protein
LQERKEKGQKKGHTKVKKVLAGVKGGNEKNFKKIGG